MPDTGADEDLDDFDRTGGGGTLSSDCADQVERVLEQRAVSVSLHPEIEDSCRKFLVQNCGAHVGAGEELQCLQDHFEALNEECQTSIREYTVLEAKNARLNAKIGRACHEIIDKECGDEVSMKDEGGVMRCLIEFRMLHEELMGETCSTAVEHWQILTLKDWRFSSKFKKACSSDVKGLCHP